MTVTGAANAVPQKIIGGLSLANPLMLAPLAGVTMPPMRYFFFQLGAGLAHTEMVSAMGLVRGNQKTCAMLKIFPGEGPLILQLFGSDTSVMAQAAEFALREGGWAAFGINMACPMPKITKRGAGSALMNNAETAFAMTRELKKAGLPVWVKIRRMTDEAATLSFIEGLLRAGADNVCLHGRTPAQRYEGRAYRKIVMAASLRFPQMISASGDVYEVADVLEYLSFGCAGVMLARGALADPYLFPRALQAMGYPVAQELVAPSQAERLSRLRALGKSATDVCGPHMAVVLLKRLIGGMFRGVKGAAEFRHRAMTSKEPEELLAVVAAEASSLFTS